MESIRSYVVSATSLDAGLAVMVGRVSLEDADRFGLNFWIVFRDLGLTDCDREWTGFEVIGGLLFRSDGRWV